MKIKIHKNDIPNSLKLGNSVAIDTEAMGLNHQRDRLCLIQLSNGNGICHLIKINDVTKKPINLIKILKDKKILKIFHYARFDIGILKYTYDINIQNIYCTKIASKLVRTFTEKHGYKDLCFELLNKKIIKAEQTSDWGAKNLTLNQTKYAATDVLYLHKLKEKLNEMLIRENRIEIAQACFNFLEHRVNLDLLGWSDLDIFKH
jgi:ribonuclease D